MIYTLVCNTCNTALRVILPKNLKISAVYLLCKKEKSIILSRTIIAIVNSIACFHDKHVK